MKEISIAGRRIGPGHPVYIVAELSANHGQDYNRAVRLLEAARAAGADAVKLQTYTPDSLTIDCDRAEFVIGNGSRWAGRRLYDLYGEAFTPWEWQPGLAEVATGLGLDLFSTPFDAAAVEFLEDLGVPCHKIASFELVDLPLIRKVAATGKPLIMSTGMASREEISEALATAQTAGAGEIALLKCTSAYPADAASMNLRTITDMAATFGVPVGLSDHSLAASVPVAAVALGACIVEKHLCLDRSAGGPDSAFSLEPKEFANLVAEVRVTEQALGCVAYGVAPQEEASRIFRRSLFVVADVAAGAPLTAANVRAIRPGSGLHTRHLDEVLGQRARCDIPRGTPLSWELVAEPE